MSAEPAAPRGGCDPDAKIVLPPAETLAQLAALLTNDNDCYPEDRIDDAICMYLQAFVRRSELEGLTLSEAIVELDDLVLLQWLRSKKKKLRKLRLYPDNAKIDPATQKRDFQGDLDPVRNYLKEKQPYIGWQKTSAVWDAIRLKFLDETRSHNELHKAIIEAAEREQPLRRREKVIWVHRDFYSSPSTRRDGEQEFMAFKNATAVWRRRPVAQAITDLENGERSEQKPLYWELDSDFLDELIRWRLSVKRNGGMERLRKLLGESQDQD